ncbi:hypothetical protein BKA82DRAFT_4193276, partial [Pisolithus tinctorius]
MPVFVFRGWFPTICHSLVLIPPAVVIPHRCVRNSSPISPSYFSLFQIMVLINETFRTGYSLCPLFLLLSFLTYNYCVFASLP